MTDIDLIKQALEYLEDNQHHIADHERHTYVIMYNDCITALKARLAQPEQEPVALPCCGYTDASAVKWNPFNGVVQCHNCGQTYTPPQRTWVDIDVDDIDAIQVKVLKGGFGFELTNFARAIEAKLKEKNA